MDVLSDDNLRLIITHISFSHLQFLFKSCKRFKLICQEEVDKRIDEFRKEFHNTHHVETNFYNLKYQNNQLLGIYNTSNYLVLSNDFVPLNMDKIFYLSHENTTKELDIEERFFFNYFDENVNLIAFEDNILINFENKIDIICFYPFHNSDGYGNYFFNDKTYLVTHSKSFLFKNLCIANYIIKGERPNGDIESITIFFGFSLSVQKNLERGRLIERGNWSQIANDGHKCLFCSGEKTGNIMKINYIDLNSFHILSNKTISLPWKLADIKSVGFNKNNVWFVVNEKIYLSTESFIFEIDKINGVWNNDMSLFYKTSSLTLIHSSVP